MLDRLLSRKVKAVDDLDSSRYVRVTCCVGVTVLWAFCLFTKVRVSVVLRSHYTLRKAAFNSVFPSLCRYCNCLIYMAME